jgi:hydroxyacylglutathione hydrolase
MITIQKFEFNPFSENTYIIFDETNECIIFDPGCWQKNEKETLKNFIEQQNLKPVRLINTHCHIDHVFGNKFIADLYQLPLEAHALEIPVLENYPNARKMFNVPGDDSPPISRFIEDDAIITFGNSSLLSIFTPGHSPGSLSFYDVESNILIAGDVLFQGSIGRTDLPGGNHKTLIQSIRERLFVLPDDTEVYPGHGPSTTIGFEKMHNPFF